MRVLLVLMCLMAALQACGIKGDPLPPVVDGN